MNGPRRHLFFAAFLLQLLFLQQSSCQANNDNKAPFFLIPALSPDGTSTIIRECIGSLITPFHIIAPASCLHIKISDDGPIYLATGVFVDYRHDGKKVYPADPNVLPLSVFTFSNDIVLHPDYKQGETDNDAAIITLSIPFSEQNALGIKPIHIVKSLSADYNVITYEHQATSRKMITTKYEDGKEETIKAPAMILVDNDSALGGIYSKDADGKPVKVLFGPMCDKWIKDAISKYVKDDVCQ